MTTDTHPLAPTDAEIWQLWVPMARKGVADPVDFARAVLAKWGSQPVGAQPAPQQEAQEPVAWYVTGCGRLLDEDEAKAEARHIGGTARAIPLYTAPQQEAQQPVACEPLIRQMRDALSLPCDRWNATQSRIVREAIDAADAWLEGK